MIKVSNTLSFLGEEMETAYLIADPHRKVTQLHLAGIADLLNRRAYSVVCLSDIKQYFNLINDGTQELQGIEIDPA